MATSQLKASIIIDLTGNLMNKSRQFSNAISSMCQKNSASFKSMANDAKQLSNSIDSLGNKAAMSFTAAGYAFNKTFIKTAAMFERYQIQSASLFGGDEGGRKAMAWAKQDAKDTVLSLEQVMDMMTEMKSFGMNPMDGTLKTMEDVSAMHGWDFDKLHGAMQQIEQMSAKGKIGMDDAKILFGYGINMYQEIATATGHTKKEIMALGAKGLLTTKAIRIALAQLHKESDGASSKAMKTWDGMISNLGDDWQQFVENVMTRGVFDKLKGRLRAIKSLVENPTQSNQGAHNTAAILNKSIDQATAAGSGLWEVLKGVGSTVEYIATEAGKVSAYFGDSSKNIDSSVSGMKTLAEIVASLYIGNKVVRMGAPLVKGGYKVARAGYKVGKGTVKAGRWSWRKIFGGGSPEIGDEHKLGAPELPGGKSAGVERVFVTNWPKSFGMDDSGSFSGSDGKKSRRKKGPGKGRSKFSRILGAGEEVLEDVENAAGKKGLWGKIKGIGNSAGRYAKGLPLLGAALTAVDVATDDNNTQRGGDIGSSAGAWVGGALGTLTDEFTGPFGTIIGAQIGQTIGDKIGSAIGSWFDDDKKPADAAAQPTNGKIDLNINLPAGASIDSSMSSFGGYNPFNLMTGGYIP
jgi:tape measure domain-containing protein